MAEAVPVVIPRAGLTMDEATVINWLAQEGDPVTEGQLLVELETDKSVVEVYAPTSGVLTRRLAGINATVAPGQVIGEIGPG